MSLFKKKCEYCREKPEKGKEYFKEVKIPGYVGTFKRAFCSEKHFLDYTKELNERSEKKSKSCCG